MEHHVHLEEEYKVRIHRSGIYLVYKFHGIICPLSSFFLPLDETGKRSVYRISLIYASVRECRPKYFPDPAQQGLVANGGEGGMIFFHYFKYFPDKSKRIPFKFLKSSYLEMDSESSIRYSGIEKTEKI